MQSSPEEYAAAVLKRNLVSDWHQAYVKSGGKDSGLGRDIQRSVPAGLYEHWKSKEGDPKYYVVFHATLEVDVHYPSVSYASLYGERAGEPTSRHLIDQKGKRLSEKDRGFLTPINREVYQGPRFRLVEKLSLREISFLFDYVDELSTIKRSFEFRRRVGKIIKRPLL